MVKCEICGKEIEKSNWRNAVLCSDECFTINFFRECLDASAIIVNGQCYHDGGYGRSHNGFKGFGGSVYKLRSLRTGEEFVTDNLWSNGVIPDIMRIDHPDTHIFVGDRPPTDY